ncbi:MAG: hypothetical protein M0P39_12410 [Rhodocyclaceae bacterium]|nr:hypothetical protein [Rhodocyclaceae bacterium]
MRIPPGLGDYRSNTVVRWVNHYRGALLIATLTLLYLALLEGPASAYGRGLMMAHFGLFLLWQPLVRSEVRLAPFHLIGLSLVTLLAIAWLNWTLVAFWLMVLAGLVGGRVFFYSGRGPRIFYLLALMYVVAALLLWAIPSAVPEVAYSANVMAALKRYLFPAMLLAMALALAPLGRSEDKGDEAIDLAYALFLVFLLVGLTQGAIAYTLLHKADYLSALLTMVLSVAAILMLVSWLWNPRVGFSGLSTIASRYALSIGLPLEQWLHSLTDLYERESDPFRLLEDACLYMVRNLPWVSGGIWRTGGQTGMFGLSDVRETEFRHQGLILVLYTRHELSPSVKWHFDLVSQLLAHFYRAKESDRELREMAYIQAVHETGARLTHDVKNLLQSLNTLVFAAQQDGDGGGASYQALLRRQLPAITLRLEQTLERLRDPEFDHSEKVRAIDWWVELQRSYPAKGVGFEIGGTADDAKIPAALFTHAAENMLQNAIDKRAIEPGIEVTARLLFDAGGVTLTVSDSGSPVRPEIAADVGERPVFSAKGFGIGLYQLARSAGLHGYLLELRSNQPGKVVWALVAN